MLLDLQVQPGAKEDAICGVTDGMDGSVRLKVKITAPADQGKANKAVISLLSKAWRIPKRDVELVAGTTSR